MARTGMAELITKLRAMVQAGTADYSIAGTTYWTDDQMQDYLDRFSTPVRIRMSEVPEYISGTVNYRDYLWGDSEIERSGSGTAVFRVIDAGGTVSGTANWTANYQQKKIRFGVSTLPPMYLESTSYDLNAAAAEAWREKAAHYAARFDVDTDNHSLKRSQLIANAERMAKYFASKALPRMVQMQRSDSNW